MPATKKYDAVAYHKQSTFQVERLLFGEWIPVTPWKSRDYCDGFMAAQAPRSPFVPHRVIDEDGNIIEELQPLEA